MERFMVMPLWLRYLVPWKVLGWVDKHSNICWANVVMWKMFGDDGDLRVQPNCFGSEPPYDYCGKFCVEAWCAKGKLKRMEKT
ncbi:hypothetical protein LCGC14_0378600 [marine sediment metagenome]|uniref:Uncharacterized protein n=1 Tax=marine sediment metagenome TaxID=412755 RepID=A0A0F9TL33_9ZZZZ